MLLLIFIAILGLGRPLIAQKSYYDYIYHLNATHFYDQTGLELATPEKLQEVFLQRKQEAYRTTVWNGVFPGFIGLATYWVYRYFPRKQDLHPTGPASMGFGPFAFFFSTLLSGIIQTVTHPYTLEIQEGITGFINSFRRIFSGPPHDEVQQLEFKYLLKKRELPTQAHQAIEWHFEKIRKQSAASMLQPLSQKEDSALIFLKKALSIPTQTNLHMHLTPPSV